VGGERLRLDLGLNLGLALDGGLAVD